VYSKSRNADPEAKAKGAERLKAWRKANPDKVREQKARSLARQTPEQRDAKAAYMKEYWKQTDKKPAYDRTYRERHAEELAAKKRQHRLDNPDQYRDRSRQHRLDNLDQYRDRAGRLYANRNPEEYRRKKRERYQRNPSQVNEYNGAWAKANPERRRAYNRKWYASNKDKAHAYWLLRRARKASRPNYVITPKDLRRTYHSPCLACGSTENIQMEHLIPIANEFSTHGIGNLASLCKPCNAAKNNRLWIEWKYSGLPRAREVFGISKPAA
jgi:5-methylcytosine-specific restriction endonuclease McrA